MKRNNLSYYFRSILVLTLLLAFQVIVANRITSQTSLDDQIVREDVFLYHNYDLYVENDVAYIIDNNSFRIYNITSDYYFAYSGYEYLENLGEEAKLHYYDDVVFVSDLIGNINIISCLNKNYPNLILSFTVTDFFDKIYEFEMNDDFLYILIEGYLKIYNMTTMSSPTSVGTFNNASLKQVDLAFNGDSLFLLNEEFGLSIYNISDPANISQLGAYFDPGIYQNIELIGHNAFLTKNENEIVAIDCFDPTNPQLLSSYNGNWVSDYRGFTRESTDLLVLTNKGFDIIDASNTNNISKAGEYRSDRELRFNGISARDDIAYMTCSTNDYWYDLFVIDYSDPENPDQISPNRRPWYFGNIALTLAMIAGYYLLPATIVGLVIFFVVRFVRKPKNEF
ncbi:MAG: hypothetical protein KAS22_06275, partial [Candidatus Heimdallarchaeota archaeon]|nr:hypothetical protein [Candidatus Heimdallarchaeota archaeon]